MKYVSRLALLATTAAALMSAPSAVHAGTWVVTPPPNSGTGNSASSSPAPSANTYFGSATSIKTTAFICAAATGTTSNPSTVPTLSGSGSYNGTWTFTWVPDNSTDWPSSYAITSTTMHVFSAAIDNAQATVSISGCSDLSNISFSLPGTNTAISPSPTYTTSTNTTDPNLTITTTTMASHFAQPTTTGWGETEKSIVTVKRAYTATYFTTNFSTPSSITLSFTATQSTVSASITGYTSSSSSGSVSVSATASDTYTGQ